METQESTEKNLAFHKRFIFIPLCIIGIIVLAVAIVYNLQFQKYLMVFQIW